MRITATVDPGRRPRSKAVRAVDVTGMPSTVVTSAAASVSFRVTINDGGRVRSQTSSAGPWGSIHWAPCRAAAEVPATTACLPDHSHAAIARSRAVSSPPRRWYTLR